jgi:hypothetical protein
MLVENFPKRTVDWFFRIYASYYAPSSWDPHYYTAALRLYGYNRIENNAASRMALDQAIRYFAEGVTQSGALYAYKCGLKFWFVSSNQEFGRWVRGLGGKKAESVTV